MKKRYLILFSLFLSACADNPDVTVQAPGGAGSISTTSTTTTLPPPPPAVDHIHIIPNGMVQIPLSGTQVFSSAAHDAAHTPITGVSFGWASSNPAEVTVAPGTPMVGQATVTGAAATTPGFEPIITLSSGTFTDTAIVEVTCQSIPSVISSITATPNPVSTLSTATIAVRVDDCDPLTPPDVPNGTPVNFTVDTTAYGDLTSYSSSTIGGVATVTFAANNVFGTVNITATVAGTAISNTIPLTVQPTPVGSINFTSATPTLLGLKGSGRQESSVIVFSVKDVSNNPIADGTNVIFTMVGPKGTSTGTPADPTKEALTFYSVSTLNGDARTVLTSGTAPGPVQITACVDTNLNFVCDDPTNSTTSGVSIGGGFPSATHFTFVTDIRNLAGLNYVNEMANLSVFLADRFGNYNILQGTSVSFITEAGAVSANATTDATGSASVVFRTQNPLPIDVDPRDPLGPYIWEFTPNPNNNGFDPLEPFEDINNNGAHDFGEVFMDLDQSGYDFREPNIRDGHVSVVSYTFGEEEFTDINGNGVYDLGEPFVDNGGEPFIDANDNGIYDLRESFTDQNGSGTYNPGEPFTDADPPEPYYDTNGNAAYDAGEPFTDINGNGVRDAVAVGFANGVYDRGEIYVDFDNNGSWTHGNGVWDGPGSPLGDPGTVIWSPLRLVFSGAPVVGRPYSRIVFDTAYMDPANPSRFIVSNGDCTPFTLYVMDQNGNHLESPSSVTVSAAKGELSTPSTWVIVDTVSTSPWTTGFTLCDADAGKILQEPTNISAQISWTSQGGGTILYNIGPISGTLDWGPPPPPLAITTASLSPGTVGVAYNDTVLATGGATPYSWNISLGSLPAGLTIGMGTGAITGTPTTATACPGGAFDVTVTDAALATDVATLCIEIVDPPVINGVPLAGGTVGVPYSDFVTATNGLMPYTWNLTGALPAGLSLNTTTGEISGTPTVPTACPGGAFDIDLTDSLSNTDGPDPFCIVIGP